MERAFRVNRTEVNKSYSRSRVKIRDLAEKSPKSRTSERRVDPPFAFFFSRSLARSLAGFTLACIASHVYMSQEMTGSSRFVLHLFRFFSLLARRYCSAQPAKERRNKSEATDLCFSISSDTRRPMRRVYRPVQ